MAQIRAFPAAWLHTKVCPRCGFAGTRLQGRGDDAVYECPCCGEDLYARPAMSYAEMEGFTEQAGPVEVLLPAALVRPSIRRPRGKLVWWRSLWRAVRGAVSR